MKNTVILVTMAAGGFVMMIMHRMMPEGFKKVVLGYPGDFEMTMQIGMWVPFWLGIGDIIYRYFVYKSSLRHFTLDYLLIKQKPFIGFEDLDRIYNNTKMVTEDEGAHLPRLIKGVTEQLKTTKSLDQGVSVLNSMLDILSQQLTLSYSRLRYLFWLIPTLGFMGTVYGISRTVGVVGRSDPEDPMLLANLAGSLAVAFDTTLLALLLSAFILLLMSFTESREEATLNKSGEFLLEKLINRVK